MTTKQKNQETGYRKALRKKNDVVAVFLEVPAPLYDFVKGFAFDQDMTKKEVIVLALENLLDCYQQTLEKKKKK